MAAILNAKSFQNALCNTVADGVSDFSGWQMLARYDATDAPNLPNSSRTATVVVTGKIVDVANIEVTFGGNLACCEVSMRNSNGGYLPAHTHRISFNRPEYAAAHDNGIPFTFIVRQAAWTTGEALELIGRVALYGDSVQPSLPPNKIPQFQVRDITFTVLDDTALGAHRVLFDSHQPGTPQVLNSFSGAIMGTPSKLHMTGAFPFRVYLTGNLLAGLSLFDTIGNAASSPTRTASVAAGATTGQNYIELLGVTNGPWQTGDHVYHGSTLIGTVALGEEKWLVFTSIKFRPRSLNDSCALWHALYVDSNFASSDSSAWGALLQGSQAHGPLAIGAGQFAGKFKTELQFGACSVVTIQNGITSIGLKGLNLYDPNSTRWTLVANLTVNVAASTLIWNLPSSPTAAAVVRRDALIGQNYLDVDVIFGSWGINNQIFLATGGSIAFIAGVGTPGDLASQYVRADVFAVKLYTLPFWIIGEPAIRSSWYGPEGAQSQSQLQEIEMGENRNAVFMASALPRVLDSRSGDGLGTFVRFNDGSDQPMIGRASYVSCRSSQNSYRESFPDLKVGQVALIEGVNNFLVRGRINPDSATSGLDPAQDQCFVVLPCHDDASLYPPIATPFQGPTIYVALGKEAVSLAALPTLTIDPDFVVDEQRTHDRPEIMTLLGYRLSASKYTTVRSQHSFMWSGLTFTQLEALRAQLETFTSGVFKWANRQQDYETDEMRIPYKGYAIDGSKWSATVDQTGKLWTARLAVSQLRYFGP